TGDIGCYTLGALPPLQSMDTCLCMGASVGMAYGLERALGDNTKTRVVAVIGDSTFLHSGITPLINIVYNGGNTVTIILDNSTTAMTGHNEHPGSGRNLKGEPAPAVDYQALVRAVGIKFAAVVDPYDTNLFRRTVKRALDHDGPAVIIAQRPCVLLPSVRGFRRPKVQLDPEKCTGCGACFRIGCPAIGQDETTDKCRINTAYCTGCGLCTTTCPCEALEL
ncbi:thiamine pyrophosphate-dependent enzyme, partial [Gemmatimonadota bacterium]